MQAYYVFHKSLFVVGLIKPTAAETANVAMQKKNMIIIY